MPLMMIINQSSIDNHNMFIVLATVLSYTAPYSFSSSLTRPTLSCTVLLRNYSVCLNDMAKGCNKFKKYGNFSFSPLLLPLPSLFLKFIILFLVRTLNLFHLEKEFVWVNLYCLIINARPSGSSKTAELTNKEHKLASKPAKISDQQFLRHW